MPTGVEGTFLIRGHMAKQKKYTAILGGRLVEHCLSHTEGVDGKACWGVLPSIASWVVWI